MKIYSINPNEISKTRMGDLAEHLNAQRNTTTPKTIDVEHAGGSHRSFTEALVIAHAARAIMTKAMETASQLQVLASKAFTGESVDRNEISRVVSTINAIISEATNHPSSITITLPINRATHTIDFSQVTTLNDQLRQHAELLQREGIANNEKLQQLRNEIESAYKIIEETYNGLLATNASFLQSVEGENVIASTFGKVVETITSQPDIAIAIQGNLFAERAAELVG